jgi:hypothetical protein
MNEAKITYEFWSCANPDALKRLQVWQQDYNLLSEKDARMIARVYKFNLERFEKLIDHKSKKFDQLYRKSYGFVKTFHPQPVLTLDSCDQRQPIWARSKDLIARIKLEQIV